METVNTYNTLEEIQLRRDQLSEDINREGEKIATMWNGMFKQQENSTRGEYIATLVANSITAIDAFLLVRKLIKNYSGVLDFFKRNDSKKKKRR
jgi:hypothetical protein